MESDNLDDFVKHTNGKDGRWNRCKKCQSEYCTAKYQERKERVYALKDKPCARCGGVFPAYVMDFHHLDPTKKEFTIGKIIGSRNMERLLAEIDKCVLVCANCHRTIHYEQGVD